MLLVWLQNIYLRPGLAVNMNRSKFVKELWKSEFVRASPKGTFNTQATPFEITPLGKKYLVKNIELLTPEEEQPENKILITILDFEIHES